MRILRTTEHLINVDAITHVQFRCVEQEEEVYVYFGSGQQRSDDIPYRVHLKGQDAARLLRVLAQDEISLPEPEVQTVVDVPPGQRLQAPPPQNRP